MFTTVMIVIILMLTPAVTYAQGLMGTNDHTALEESEGKEIWKKMQAKQLTCNTLSDEDYQALGEYVMGQSIGDTQKHALMNQMMSTMMGEEAEKRMHITIGKRFSDCETPASYPQNSWGFMPMMWMMGYGGWNGLGLFGWIPMLLFWMLLILGVVALVCYLGRLGQHDSGKTPLEILKERYAKGEIDKKEFEQMKKDLV